MIAIMDQGYTYLHLYILYEFKVYYSKRHQWMFYVRDQYMNNFDMFKHTRLTRVHARVALGLQTSRVRASQT
jgi:hypothetical protein